MTDSDDLLFATIDSIPIPDCTLAAKEILALSDNLSFWDDYRCTKMYPLMNRTGTTSRQGNNNNQDGEFVWVDHAPKTTVNWCEDYLFPWLGTKSRVMALVTQPGAANYEHIDCQRHELNTRQHKVRLVLQGHTDTLYWITDQGRVAAPQVQQAFVMDGGWPHGMVNDAAQPKVTIAIGAPWSGKNSYDDITILQRRSQYTMPQDIDHLWRV